MANDKAEAPKRRHSTAHKRGGLKELPATAICGNDITSSTLYVSALAIMAGGKWAWLSLLFVAAVLFLFRSIYAEVVGTLPLNGGAYNALLNTTSKRMASLAACLTVLSYMATAVISANVAMHYAPDSVGRVTRDRRHDRLDGAVHGPDDRRDPGVVTRRGGDFPHASG